MSAGQGIELALPTLNCRSGLCDQSRQCSQVLTTGQLEQPRNVGFVRDFVLVQTAKRSTDDPTIIAAACE